MIGPRVPLALLPAAGVLAAGLMFSVAGMLSVAALAEQPAPPPSAAPPPAVTAPLPTTTKPDPSTAPGTSSPPSATQAVTPPVPPAAPPAAGAAPASGAARTTLVETPGDANDVDEVSLPAKPALVLAGHSKWEEAVPSLKASFARIEAELARLGIAPTGRPIAVFTRTEDDGFQYEAMVPVARMPDPKPPETEGFRFAVTPSGKALRFPHKGSYDAIDGTYETLTAYLDVKDVVVQDRFIEEYVTDLSDKADDKLDVNIYALLK